MLLENEVLYVRRNEDVITHIKRVFDNYGTRIDENILMSEIFDVDKKPKPDLVEELFEEFFEE